MKYPVFASLILLAGCASRNGSTVERALSQKIETSTGAPLITSLVSNADSRLAWKKIENLTGEPLVDSLISYGDIDLAELKERRRNVRLEIAALAAESKGNGLKEQLNSDLTQELHEKALDRKMTLWKAIHSMQ